MDRRFEMLRWALLSISATGCGAAGASLDAGVDVQTDAPTGLAVLGRGAHVQTAVRVATVSTEADGLNTPRDLAFHNEVPDQLWVVNFGDNSVVVIDRPGDATQTAVHHRGSSHFLARPAAIAFGMPGRMATSHEEDRVTQRTTTADFMGPTLWPSDPDVFDGSDRVHLDMLHNSPNSVGLAWASANIYWVFDGSHQALTRYNFNRDHGPGGQNHADGDVARFVEGQLGYVPEVSAGMEVDRTTGLLYVSDTGHSRVVVLDPSTGRRTTAITPNYDGDRQYRMADATLRVLADGRSGLQGPSGLALRDGVIYVADNTTSKIYGLTLDGTVIDWLDLSSEVAHGGLMGIEVGPSGTLFVVDALTSRVLSVAALP